VVKRVAGGDTSIVKVAAIDKVDVHVSVAVVIRHAHAGSRFFEDGRRALASLEMDEADPGGLRDVVELDRWSGWRANLGRSSVEERKLRDRKLEARQNDNQPNPLRPKA